MSMDLISSALVSQSLNAFKCIFARARALFNLHLNARASHCGNNPSRFMPVDASKSQFAWFYSEVYLQG